MREHFPQVMPHARRARVFGTRQAERPASIRYAHMVMQHGAVAAPPPPTDNHTSSLQAVEEYHRPRLRATLLYTVMPTMVTRLRDERRACHSYARAWR